MNLAELLGEALPQAGDDELQTIQMLLGKEFYRRARREVDQCAEGPSLDNLKRLAGVVKSKHTTARTYDEITEPLLDGARKAFGGAEQKKSKDHNRNSRLTGQDEDIQHPGPGDDRHFFASGASSSGRKPNYLGTMPLFAYERFARHREFGDNKHGIDNYLKGCRDKAFILDRINHGIEHLMNLASQVKMGGTGNWMPGYDDAAAVMCAGMFVMCYQQAMAGPGMLAAATATENSRSALNKISRTTAIPDESSYGHGV